MEISGRGRAAELAKVLLGVQEIGQTAGRTPSKARQQNDRIQISDHAKELQRITALTHETDDARVKKIEQLRQAIDTGTYSVDGRAVGDAIIKHALADAAL